MGSTGYPFFDRGMGMLYLLYSGFVVSVAILLELSLDFYYVMASLARAAFGVINILSARFLRCEDDLPPIA